MSSRRSSRLHPATAVVKVGGSGDDFFSVDHQNYYWVKAGEQDDEDISINYLARMFPEESCILRHTMEREGLRQRGAGGLISDRRDDRPFSFSDGQAKQGVRAGYYTRSDSCSLTVAPWVRDSLSRCGKRFVVSTLHIACKDWYHQNSLIFDRFTRRMVRFEPHGALRGKSVVEKLVYEKLNDQLREWMVATVSDMYDTFTTVGGWQHAENAPEADTLHAKFTESMKIRGVEFCVPPPREEDAVAGVDLRVGYGYCVTWSLLFLHMRLSNPQLSEEEIVEQLQGYGPYDLMRLVTAYANVIGYEVDRRLDF